MTRIFLFLGVVIICAAPVLVFAQPLPIVQQKGTLEGFDAAKSFYEARAYIDALPIFQRLLADDAENSNLNFLVGDCFMNIPGYDKDALPFLEKAAKNIIVDYNNLAQQRRAPVFAYQKLADLQYSDYRFDDAVTNYRVFRTYLDIKKDKALFDEINRKIETTLFAKKLVDNPLKMNLTEVPFVNVVSFIDYNGVMDSEGSTMYFSRKRSGATGNTSSDVYYMRKIDGKWGRPVRMPFVNSDANDNFCWLSPDGNQMIISSNREGNYRLYMCERKGKSQWTIPEPLNANINTRADESFACISNDGKTLYLVSDRKGGFGGKDIYRSVRTSGGDWGPAENMGEKVYTARDEDSPFAARDGRTLYFSSKGHETMGGYDVFYVTQTTSSSLSDPLNAGYPINTIGEDLFFNRSGQGKPDYFITRARTGSTDYQLNALNDSEVVVDLSELKTKEIPKERPKLKLVPKTLKY